MTYFRLSAVQSLFLWERSVEGRKSLSLRERLGEGYRTGPIPSRIRRSGFTLVELLVAITIIGLLAALALGGMYRANLSAKQTNTKTTVTKVAMQLNEIWESYRTRKIPIDAKQMLTLGAVPPYQYQYPNAVAWLTYFSAIRNKAGINATTDPINAPTSVNPNTGLANAYANNVQIAAIKLAATRELMRLEMPCRFSDFTSSTSGSPQNALAVKTLLIPQPVDTLGNPTANPGGLSEQYRQFFKANANSNAWTFQYESAECLYMIIKFASQNELGQRSITDDPRLVGDVDGDGMPEIQDAFVAGMSSPMAGSPYTQYNTPIAFVRWPAGFLSDLQPGPIADIATQSNTAQYFEPTPYEYAAAKHDIFDPLRVDPRAFTLTPLVFSAGPDGTYDIWEHNALPNAAAYNDPYFTDGTPASPAAIFPINPGAQYPLPGGQMGPGTSWGPSGTPGSGGYIDNITNHQLSTRVK